MNSFPGRLFLFAAALIAAQLLASCAADGAKAAPPELVGAPWTVTEIDGAAPVKPGHVTIVFAAEGRFSGPAPCNRYGGSYTAEGESLELSDVQSTLMGCVDDAASAEETRFYDALAAVTRYGADGARGLVLFDGNAARIRATR